jgi:PAS domain S-box-containing protein
VLKMNMRQQATDLVRPLIDDSVPAMVWTARPDMSCEYLSRPWLEFTGYTAEQALGEGWSRGVHPEDLARWLDTCVRAFDAREPFEIEYRLRRRDGEYRWVLDRGVPRYDAGGAFLGYVGNCVDIDQRKRSESGIASSLERERKLHRATEEASRLKDGFLASILEDLQSPVHAIMSCTSHLRQQVSAGSEAARALDLIEGKARAQRRMIGSLLDLSRAAGGSVPPQPTDRQPLLAGAKVLVVDEDLVARESTARTLAIAGAQTRSAGSPSEALDTMSRWRPDVLLIDLGMRAEAGLVLMRAVRALPAELGGSMRAVALAPHAAAQYSLHALRAGFDAELAKPVGPVALLATIARLAGK